MHKISAAHKTLPLGSWVKVTNLETQKQLMLEVNDRGPFVKDRLIDLSLAAAKELDIIKAGTAKVRVESIRAPKNLARETTPHLFQIGAFRNIENLKHLKQSMLSDSSLKNVTFKIEKNNDLYRLFASVPSNNLNEIKAWGIKNHTKPIEVKTGV
jgi:rare lipoprotein A